MAAYRRLYEGGQGNGGGKGGKGSGQAQYFCLQPPLQPPNERGNLGLVCM